MRSAQRCAANGDGQSSGDLRARIGLVVASILAANYTRGAEPPENSLEEIIVTAQRRAENLQAVPVSIQVLDSLKLQQLQVSGFDSYAKYMTSLAAQTRGPGQEQLYIRGVTTGTDGLRVGSQPLVGVYVDEMPVATIAESLDLHIYDMKRIEALSGPQGTLFGSSSMAGTLRLITNKPDTATTSGAIEITGNTFTNGGEGALVQGFVNVPLTANTAVRLVGYVEHDGGYINNVIGPPQTFPTSGIARNNAALAGQRFNDVDTVGARAALKIDLNDRWTITPSVMAQRQIYDGTFFYKPSSGDLNVSRYMPDGNRDRWWLAALTIEGRISNFDLTYSAGYLRRNVDNTTDYSDYTFDYDVYYSQSAYPSYFGDNFRDNFGILIAPAERAVLIDRFSKQSQELRIMAPSEWRLHGVAGLFLQRQADEIRSEFAIAGLADRYSISNLPGVQYLNSQRRTDRDRAIYTDWSYALTDTLTAAAGVRQFAYDNTVYGFFGYNGRPNYNGATAPSGEQICFDGTQTTGTLWPCVNIDSRATGSGETHRVNLTYQFDPDRMIYATWSTGFRPGGINRVRTRPPYQPDYLTNFEIGWKTQWFDDRLRFNGALFFERWKDTQLALFGPNNIVELTNAGRAEIKGVEAQINWRATNRLTLSAGLTALHAHVTTNVCTFPSPSQTCAEANIVRAPDGTVLFAQPNTIRAPSGARLPISPKIKGSLTGRYEFSMRGFPAYAQAALVGQSDVLSAIDGRATKLLGAQPGYASTDLSAGLTRGHWRAELILQNVFDRRGEAGRFAACNPRICPSLFLVPISPRRVGITIGRDF